MGGQGELARFSFFRFRIDSVSSTNLPIWPAEDLGRNVVLLNH